MLMVGCQPYCGISRRFEYWVICGDIHAIEADIGLQYLGRCLGWGNTTFDGLGSSGWTERYSRRRMERAPIQRFKRWRMATGWATLCVAIPALQWLELDHSRGVQARWTSNAGMDQP